VIIQRHPRAYQKKSAKVRRCVVGQYQSLNEQN